MGKTGELFRTVFSKTRSVPRHNNIHANRNNVGERKRWDASVRSYFCADELNSSLQMEDSASFRSSVVAEGDLTSIRGISVISSSSVVTSVWVAEDISCSVRSSEITVDQPLYTYGDNYFEDIENKKEKENSTYEPFNKEDAAVIIQSAFRSFRVRRAAKLENVTQSRSRDSISTSIEVQTGNSSNIFTMREESIDLRHHMRHRAKAQVLKLQEDWDDSTVSSFVSKMRTQQRLDAATRRERALAYAFSQQLRIRPKKRQSTTKGIDMNVGWSWLERWMATRKPEIYPSTDDVSVTSRKTVVTKRLFLDSSMEEKEGCGSNDISSLVDINILSVPRQVPRPSKLRSKTTRDLSRKKSASSNLCTSKSKDVNKIFHVEDENKKGKDQSRMQETGSRIQLKSHETNNHY